MTRLLLAGSRTWRHEPIGWPYDGYAAAFGRSTDGVCRLARDELFGDIGHALHHLCQASECLELGQQFDDQGCYTALAEQLIDDLDETAVQLTRWQESHGYQNHLARFRAVIGADTEEPEEDS